MLVEGSWIISLTIDSLLKGILGVGLSGRVCAIVCDDVSKNLPVGSAGNEWGGAVVCNLFVPKARCGPWVQWTNARQEFVWRRWSDARTCW